MRGSAVVGEVSGMRSSPLLRKAQPPFGCGESGRIQRIPHDLE